MRGYLAQRALGAIFAILGVSIVVFVILRLSGDPAALLLDSSATHDDYLRLRAVLGLDEPLPVQYLKFIGGAATGQFGTSFQYKQPALAVVLDRAPVTALLAIVALSVTLLVSIPLGVASATHQSSAMDRFVSVLTLIGQAVPSFWLGIVLILIVSVGWGLLPVSGTGTPQHLVLPALALAAAPISKFTRLTRSELMEVLSQDYIRTARAKGLGEAAVVYGHALRNSAIALVTLVGLDVGYLLGGSIIVETVFAWPGVGRLMIDAISRRDFPIVQADVFLMACVVVVVNFIVDVGYSYLDPRLRLQSAR